MIHVSARRLVGWLQVWMVVQRKWMYLESIFIGGDIRAQLPEEAKKFDDIDKTFKKVSVFIIVPSVKFKSYNTTALTIFPALPLKIVGATVPTV